jgi:hypothetical protein
MWLTKYIRKGNTWNMRNGSEKCVQNCSWKAWKKDTTSRVYEGWDVNINVDIKLTECDMVEPIHRAEDRHHWRADMNKAMKLRVP